MCSYLEHHQSIYLQGSCPSLNNKFKYLSRTFTDTFPIFQGLHSVHKRTSSLCFSLLPQHEWLYPEGLSVFASFSLKFYLNYWIQGLVSTNCNFQGLSRPWIFIHNSRTFKVRSNPVFLALFKKNKLGSFWPGSWVNPFAKIQLTCNFL